MAPAERPPPPAAPAVQGVLRDQRDANEQLVLATLRAQAETDTARDARRAAEALAESMRVRAEELLAVAEFRERLIGIVGHDLRNPLNSMLMASGLLLAHGELSEADGRLVHRIVDSGQRIARMITQVLDFTRGKLGGGFSLEPTRADLGEIFRDVVEEHRLGSGAEIQLEVAGDVVGRWDGDRLAAVASNLVGNALDHSTPATPVTVRIHGDEGMVFAEVSNLGPPIPIAMLPTMFLPYRSGSSERRRVGHMGLGLYISSEMARSHGGTLGVRSADGSTTFTLSLPRTFVPS